MIALLSGACPPGEGLVEGLKKTPAEVAFIVYSIVQDPSRCTNLLEYCGGDLLQAIGDVVALKIRSLNQFGASELGLTTNMRDLRA